MIDQAEMILDHFPGNDFLLSCTSIADHKNNFVTYHFMLKICTEFTISLT